MSLGLQEVFEFSGCTWNDDGPSSISLFFFLMTRIWKKKKTFKSIITYQSRRVRFSSLSLEKVETRYKSLMVVVKLVKSGTTDIDSPNHLEHCWASFFFKSTMTSQQSCIIIFSVFLANALRSQDPRLISEWITKKINHIIF